jgi:VanZ like family
MAAIRRVAPALGRFAPPLALMALIYALSAQPDLNSGLGWIDLVGRKAVHMAEYGLLFLLWWRAFRWRAPLAAALVAIGYAAIDELHQLSVHGRVGSVHDVAIDAAGVALAWLLARAVRQRRRAAASAAARSPERTAPSI